MNEEAITKALYLEFGYRQLDEGEKWVVWQNHTLIVVHPERKPRLYPRGRNGLYYEIEPLSL